LTTHEAMSWLLGDVADSASVLLEHLVRCLNNLVPSKEIETFDADRFSYQLSNAELGLQSVVFLAKHCIKAETAREFGCVEFSAGFYRDRLIFPVTDDEQQTVGFVATDVLGKDDWLKKNPKLVDPETKELRPTTLSDYRKVLYPRNFKVGNYLVGMHSFKKNDTAILVEGCRDVMKLRQEDFSGTLGLGSANITDNQLQSMSRLAPKKIIVMLDGDTVGRQNGIKVAARCCRFFDQVFVVQLSDGRDPKDLMRSEVLFHLKHKTEQVKL
jgi:DNA primase